MPIDLKARRAQLRKREQELMHDLDASGTDARDAAPLDEAEDTTDAAVADEERDAVFVQSDREYEELVEVRDALKRIDAGTYGKCEICGREIESARLDAVPATRYCVEDARAREPKISRTTL